MAQEKTYIYGKHVVVEALRSIPGAIDRVFVAPQVDDKELRELLHETKTQTRVLAQGALPQEIMESAHQGIVGIISLEGLLRPYREFADTLTVNPDTALVLLDEIQDPQNVGAIIRSAAAFGIRGVLIPEHNQAQLTGMVLKVSAGMAFRVPLVGIGNVNMTVRDLKDRGFWIYGLDEAGNHPLSKEVFDVPALFVLGNEAKGIRQKTRELCDILLSIPLNPECESLNVAASAAVTLYAWSSEHPNALRTSLKK
ncbi:MAG: RNA methyltransferase, TrmH family, group 3 [Parcubacteria group bacterium GW2011_GWA1_47_8]|nr:MAG: RNA methyltransferase, TrmH family, group 3 [Parcubacteria group bacterium GW2011_GWA1_47_8]KKW07838.1 MAG: RNA methyltransferase, TrmH family, group 3 [Parcubacteria group bacterium GW2011_GWA2_49_16]